MNDKRFNYLSDNDRELISDAITLECDVFLTLDLKLVKQSHHIEKELGLKVLTPKAVWSILKKNIHGL